MKTQSRFIRFFCHISLSFGLVLVSIFWLSFSASAQTDWVINTNYPQPGSTSPAPIRGEPAKYGDYSNMETDPVGVSQDERAGVLAKLQKELAPGLNVVTFNVWSDVVEGLNAIQIVNNVPLQGALFTIILPPRWSRTEHVPVVLSGTGLGDSNNKRLWKNGDTGLIGLVGLSALPGFNRIIAAYCNAGGMESQGVDDHTYRAVGAFFDFISQNGGDKMQGVTVGSSRGGLDAFMWAANPLKLDYQVIATFADVLPTALGKLSRYSVQTYPNLSFLFTITAHNPDLYRYGLPNGPGDYDLTPLIGVADPAQADERSPIGIAERLRGKVLVIGRGTHDPYFPLTDFLALDHRLDALGIPHMTVITLGNGHTSSSFVSDRFANYIRGLMTGKLTLPAAGRFFLINLAPPDGKSIALSAFLKEGLAADPKDVPQGSLPLPFSAEIPAGAGAGLPVDVALCGANGKRYSYSAQDASGKVWSEGTGVFGPEECVQMRVAAPDVLGDYTWAFSYDGQPLLAYSGARRDKNGCSLPIVTHVTAEQPSPAMLNAPDYVSGFGVDQYSVQPMTCP